uniref:Uncharacterized protein n=1 Tax=Anguilla anguilla TaxID=7936 RepID=A0A0E9QXD6_ANGAN
MNEFNVIAVQIVVQVNKWKGLPTRAGIFHK